MSDVLELLLGLANGVHDDLDVAAEAVNEIIDLEQEITRLRAENAELRTWKQAIIDGLIVREALNVEHETDPKKAVNALVAWEAGLVAHEETAKLRAQIAAHEKVCAGKWVSSVALPRMWLDVAIIEDGKVLSAFVNKSRQWRDVNQNGYTPTHWLDARLPGEER